MKQALTILAMAVAISTASAQRAAPTAAEMAAHQVQRYTSMLSLNTAQQEEATTIFSAAAATETSLRTEQQTAHQALDTSITAGDTTTITQAAAALGTIEGELATARALAEAKLYKVLTADQQTKFAAMLAQPMGRGMGGPPPLR